MHKTRKALLASLLTSVTVALGLALSAVPNIELMTITVFISGYLLGWRLGMTVGAASIAAHSLFNPLGAALPQLLVSQIIGFAIIGLGGASIGPWIVGLSRRRLAFLLSSLAGFLLTFLYDVLTNIGAFFSITGDQAPSNLLKFVGAGMVFMMMHLVWNTALFVVVLTPVLSVLTRYRLELSEGR